MFERYTERARRVIFFARFEASESRHREIDVVHLALGALRESRALFQQYCGVDNLDRLREALWALAETTAVSETKVPKEVDMSLSTAAKQVLDEAAALADEFHHRHIGTEHMLLALTRQSGPTTEVLTKLGVSAEKLATRAAVGPDDPDSRSATMTFVRVPKDCVEFVDAVTGSRVAIGSLTSTTTLPRTGDVMVFEGQQYSVVEVRLHYARSFADYKTAALECVRVLVRTLPARSRSEPDST